VVDSSQKLADWSNNVEGNDYTSVLIKKGTWTLSKELSVGTLNDPAAFIKCNTTGTKFVHGEAGSKLDFTTTSLYAAGIFGNTLLSENALEDKDFGMFNVNINMNETKGTSVAFHYCSHLTRCTGTTRANNKDASTNSFAFYKCSYLTECTGDSSGSSYMNSESGALICTASAFMGCNSLTGCIASATGSCTSTNSSSLGYGRGFDTCLKLVNCNATATGVGTSGRGIGAAFYNCKSLYTCTGTGASGNGSGYVYLECRVMFGCSRITWKTACFSSCYMHVSGTTDPVADTAAGGYNRDSS
jgi:hypothetical protein